MKIKELLEHLDRTDEGVKSNLAALTAAGALAFHPADIKKDQQINPPQISAEQPKQDAPFYKIGKPYKRHGKTYHPKNEPHYSRIGLASWYGPGFHGKKTANNDIFDTDKLVAAHPTLPLPSKVWVTNLENGKKIMVTVTDRGPYAKNRLIDLSKKAAEELGFSDKGTAKVRVEFDPKATIEYLKDHGLYDQYREANKLLDK